MYVNLYERAPIKYGIAAMINLLTRHSTNIEMYCLAVPDVAISLQQTPGLAMGSCVAPPFTIVSMRTLEHHLQTASLKPACYMHYIDDVLKFGPMERGHLVNFGPISMPHIRTSNSPWSQRKYDGGIAFLDKFITLKHKNNTELYIKPASSEVLIHFSSAQLRQTKK